MVESPLLMTSRAVVLVEAAICSTIAFSASPAFSLDCPVLVAGDVTLQEDVVCTTALPSEAVSMAQGVLRLNGFTVDANGLVDIVVDCSARRCDIVGPGTITGGVVGINGGKVRLLDGVSVTGNAGAGIQAPLVLRAA